MTELGLRERKKQETRQRIASAAMRLFAERGFEAVPVTEIAGAADVSPATVFNYFPTKEDLIYDGMADFHAELLAAIRDRPRGTTVVSAYRDFVFQRRGLLASPDPNALEAIAPLPRVIHESPSLQARERHEADKSIAALAELVAEDLDGDAHDLRPWAVASALVGISRAMARMVQEAAVEGRAPAEVAEDVFAAGTAAIDMLDHGLAQDGRREGPRG